MSAELTPDYNLAALVADAISAIEPQLAAVFIGGVGTDWERAPAYPFAAVRVESAEQPRGGVTRTVRVRLVSRIADAAAPAKPVPLGAGGRVFLLIGADEVAALAERVRNALTAADLGAPLESISTEYDADSQFPVQTADLVLVFADAQAYGDSF